MKLKALHEDILGDLKRKLKGQVSLEKNLRRVAEQELKTALTRVETLDEILNRDEAFEESDSYHKVNNLLQGTIKGINKALKNLDRIK